MNRYEFIDIVENAFDECETKEQMDSRFKAMKEIIQQMYMVKSGLKQDMREFK